MLTPKQKDVYDFVKNFIQQHGQSPTTAEIQEHFGLSSPGSVHKFLTVIQAEGLIQRIPNAPRGIELTGDLEEPGECHIPVLGTVAAGKPVEVFQRDETVTVPRKMMGKGYTYALVASGDSMIDAGITDGTIIVVEATKTAYKGEMIVALVNGRATVKDFFPGRSQVELRPRNATHRPIIVRPTDSFEIQGIVTGWVHFNERHKKRRLDGGAKC